MRGDGASGWVDYADEGGAAAALETLHATDIVGGGAVQVENSVDT
jgi:hypothetical protein